MNFTREPMIETVITPREGMKLLVRSSKSGGEEYVVDAVEVVSFGQSLFFRSTERPKSFLVPVSDYEILELKEVRMALKTASPERSIKIGGGREQRPQQQQQNQREHAPEEQREPQSHPQEQQNYNDQQRPSDRKNKRRRGRRGRHEPMHQHGETSAPQELSDENQEKTLPQNTSDEQKSPSFISKLFPPPPTLIKETLSRYKPVEPPISKEEDFGIEEKFEVEEQIFELPETTEGSEDEN